MAGVRHLKQEARRMKAKILSVRADQDFRAIRIGDNTDLLSANEYLEREIQKFLDENPKIQIRHVQFAAVSIIPKTASWDTTRH
ncbi:MAG: hypothetical protein D6735_13080 [Acidobacteria bacterium]|nr:MAG: hypothetical protein D6735_13080 [Acidobacteriota bacterium]